MKIDIARYEGGALILSTRDPAARRFVYQFKPGDYEIKKTRKRRSLDANALCWAMCEQIARVVGITKEDVYRQAIKDVGEHISLVIAPDAVESFLRAWGSKGIGWVAEIADDAPQGKLVHAYYGSSVYDTSAMSRLIDWLMQMAKELDLDVISERERSLLLSEWEEQYASTNQRAGNQ
jgi:hypothetical protein